MRFITVCLGAFAAGGVILGAGPLEARRVFENLPLIGSIGGNPFSRECPDNHVLTGIRFRQGAVLDGVGILCRPVKADGTLGAEISSGSMAGGGGGTAGSVSCPANAVIAQESGLSLGVGISKLFVGCFKWFPGSKTWAGSRLTYLRVAGGGMTLTEHACAEATQPATGIRGKHGSLINSFGLHCSAP